MKKTIMIISVFAALVAGKLSAQDVPVLSPPENSRTKLHIGAKAGINSAGAVDAEETFSTRSKIGFAGGVFFQVPIGEYLGIHPEVLISQKGFKGNGQFLGTTYEMKRTTTHLDIPILVAFKPVEMFTVVGGPQYSYLINKVDVFKDGNITTIQEQEFENDNIRRNVLSMALGLDINIRRFVVSGRYNIDLQQNNGDGSAGTPAYKNTWIQGTVGMRF